MGNTAIAAYSSANGLLAGTPRNPTGWLTAHRNLKSSFLNDTVRAVYFLDPPHLEFCVRAGRSWARRGGSDKRVRLYSRDNWKTAFRTLLELDRKAPALPAAPFIVDSAEKKRTVACLPTASWVKLVKTPSGTVLKWWDTHHFIPATVLTHALAQGDL